MIPVSSLITREPITKERVLVSRKTLFTYYSENETRLSHCGIKYTVSLEDHKGDKIREIHYEFINPSEVPDDELKVFKSDAIKFIEMLADERPDNYMRSEIKEELSLGVNGIILLIDDLRGYLSLPKNI